MTNARTSLRRLLLIAGILLSGAAQAEEGKSQYTSLQNCETLDHLKLPGRVIEKGDGAGIFRCKGIDDYSVYVIDQDPRSFLVLGKGGKLFSLEKPLLSDFKLGEFPNVSGAQKAEWRLDADGKAAGLIVRVSYMRTDKPGASASALFVFDLRGDPALIGSAPTNEEARGLIDGALGAGVAAEEKLSRECNKIYAELCKGFKPGPEMLGGCYDKRPSIADKVPPKCTADFQTNIENYHEAMGGGK
ncbi:hypothetical protein [Methylocystis heyeri]|uniref:Uncharacterized protein n=1 Tax=Methylocystis heyeri TaxID=391905 RepID=A0A6B8KBW7_9HYPH|nr:hypothetical protein [Methylocystis heyeri]QGM44541.1 hypothetical protein H2LOC_001875 [Methylocystis heyeri]